jgi:protein xylosyltransferase
VLVQRENYLYQELNILSKTISNIHLTNKRYPTTWGSSTLLTAHLEAFKQIFEELKWNFSFIINLSESDFPLKPVQILTNFLSMYTSYNFLRSHNREPFKYVFLRD